MTKMKQIKSTGFVNFPAEKYEDSGENGVFVRLVVVPYQQDDKILPEFMKCGGGMNYVIYDETYLGADKGPKYVEPPFPPSGASLEEYEEYLNECFDQNEEVDKFFFPNFYDDVEEFDQYRSVPFLAAMTIGSTNWSSGEWICTYDDLTEEGKELYNKIKSLYEGVGEIYLQTWLDT